jgi:hypothetical protein
MDLKNHNRCTETRYAFSKTENRYEEGSFRGADFRRGIAATPQLTQNAASF